MFSKRYKRINPASLQDAVREVRQRVEERRTPVRCVFGSLECLLVWDVFYWFCFCIILKICWWVTLFLIVIDYPLMQVSTQTIGDEDAYDSSENESSDSGSDLMVTRKLLGRTFPMPHLRANHMFNLLGLLCLPCPARPSKVLSQARRQLPEP